MGVAEGILVLVGRISKTAAVAVGGLGEGFGKVGEAIESTGVTSGEDELKLMQAVSSKDITI